MNPPTPADTTLTLPTSLVLELWEKVYHQPFPLGRNAAFDWLELTAPAEVASKPLAFSGFAEACARMYGVDRSTALLLVASVAAGVAGRTLLRPGGGSESVGWSAAVVDDRGGSAGTLCQQLFRPVEAVVAKILMPGDAHQRQVLAQREQLAGDALKKVRQQINLQQQAIAAGRGQQPLPPDLAAAEIHRGLRALKTEQDRLELELARVRFLKRQQVFCGLLGEAEVKDRPTHGFDGALMEIACGGALADHLAATGRRTLETVRAWRNPAPAPHTILYHAGRMGGCPALSSLWIADSRDLCEVMHSPKLAPLHLLDPFLMIEDGGGSANGTIPQDLWTGWWLALAGVFEDRLLDRRHMFVPDDQANKVFSNGGRLRGDRTLAETLKANPAIHRFPQQLAAVIRRLGDARTTVQHTITAEDAELAMEIAETVVKSTATIRHKLSRTPRRTADDASDADIDLLLVKLAKLGPSKLRDLTRAFHRPPGKQELLNRINRAVAAGLVAAQPDGVYALRSHLAESQRVGVSAEFES